MKKLMPIALSVLLFAACQKEETPASKAQFDEVALNQKAPEKQSRPLSGDINNAPVPGIPPVDCGFGLTLSGKNFLYGTVSHLGRLKSGSFGIAQNCTVFTDGKATYKEIWVAANGDQVFIDSYIIPVADPLIPNEGTWTGEGVITGGTGRFEGASGSWQFLNTRYFADGTSKWSVSGEITY